MRIKETSHIYYEDAEVGKIEIKDRADGIEKGINKKALNFKITEETTIHQTPDEITLQPTVPILKYKDFIIVQITKEHTDTNLPLYIAVNTEQTKTILGVDLPDLKADIDEYCR